MNNLLTKEELQILLEAAIDYNDSVMGGATNGIGKGIKSLFGGIGSSIKKGIKISQINTLIMQYGMEFVKAIEKYDNKTGDHDGVEHTGEDSKTLDANNKKTIIDGINIEMKLIDELITISNTMVHWKLPTSQTPNEFQYVKAKLRGRLLNIESLDKLFQLIDIAEIPTANNKYEIYITEINKILSLITSSTDFKPVAMHDLQKFGMNIDFLQMFYEHVLKFLNTHNESFINEASELKLPSKIENLYPSEKLDELKQIKNIKSIITKNINFEALRTIESKAEFIIEKARNTEGESNTKWTSNKNQALKLKQKWDEGKNNIYNYFQEVIDADTIRKGSLGKEDSEINTEKITGDKLTAMGLTNENKLPTNIKFDNNKLYALDVKITGQNGKFKTSIILMSPTTKFDAITKVRKADGSDEELEYKWFKLFGTYNVKGNEIIRVNTFNGYTRHVKLIDQFEAPGDSVYVCMNKLNLSGKTNNMFVYSKLGYYYYHDEISDKYSVYKDINTIKTELLANNAAMTPEEIKAAMSPASNVFKLIVNERFVLDESNYNKFPGIDINDVKIDKNIDTAKANHSKLLNTIL